MALKSRPENTTVRPDDPDLVALRALRDDPAVFEQFYLSYYPRLFEFILRIVGHPADVEEAINDTMLVVWNKADDFGERSKVSTWVFGIAYKKALKRLKANRRLADREVHGETDLLHDADPATTVGSRNALERVRQAVAALPVAQRSIVHLAFFYGYTYPEIAAIVGCPVNTVKTRMFYARERLRPVLDDVAAAERNDG